MNYKGATSGDQFGIYGSNKRAKKLLRWEPKIKIKEGLGIMFNHEKVNYEAKM